MATTIQNTTDNIENKDNNKGLSDESKLLMYGTAWCSDCKRSKEFFGEHRVPYEWIDVDEDPEGLAYIEQVQNGGHSVPTILFPDGSVLIEPSNAALAEKLGISTKAKCSYYDVIVVGGGPAGLTAALYTARDGFSTLVIDRAGLGGQAAITERLDNYPGFPEGVSGGEFADRLVQQVRRFGVETISAQRVVGIRTDGDYRIVSTEDGSDYSAMSVLIATGSRYKRPNIPGEARLIGSSVHYCATCDGPFYRDKELVVIGGGDSAVEEGLFLTNFASHVTLLVRGDHLRATQLALADFEQHRKAGRIDALYNTEVVEFSGRSKPKEVKVRNRLTGQVSTLTPAPAGVFVFIGLSPNAEFLPPSIERDQAGFIVTSKTLETSMPGVFAAGDVRADSTNQAASAAGEGATAALMIRSYLHEKVGSRVVPSLRRSTVRETEGEPTSPTPYSAPTEHKQHDTMHSEAHASHHTG
ncbi:MAG TPA: FAD-dependent oxidoreductase [Chloroflexia bacterium]|jgi:thioredoxin reductase (NADPH)